MLNGNDSTMYQRSTTEYLNCSDRFVILNRAFETQYAPFYNVRLSQCTETLRISAQKKWGNHVPIKKLCDITIGECVIVIGTICKDMELRPSILKEISEEHHLVPQAVVDMYASENDHLILEDDSQRIIMSGDVDPHKHVTGIIVAVLGSEQEGGKFLVEDVCYTSVSEPSSRPTLNCDVYVMLVSGLELRSVDTLFPLQLLIDYLTGVLGNGGDQEMASSIARVIIAGNSLGACCKDKEFSNKTKAKYLTRKTKATTVEGVKLLDKLLNQLAMSVEVDIMPGEFDPANHLMPQQPLHPCMFPSSSKYSSFHCVTNPYEAQINGIRFLGTSGQNIKDIMAYSRLDDPIEVLQLALHWGHLSPTAPDTLNCYPFVHNDPFVIRECPHVFFAGNMPKFDSKIYGSSRSFVTVVSVPKFSETFTVALVNLRTLSVEPFVFQV